MSASTVSITVDPAARHLPVVALEKNTNIKLLNTATTNEATPPQATTGKKHSKELSHHSIRDGEKDLAKKSSFVAPNNPNMVVCRDRTKVGVARPKQVQSQWVAIAWILAKNFVLFVVLARFWGFYFFNLDFRWLLGVDLVGFMLNCWVNARICGLIGWSVLVFCMPNTCENLFSVFADINRVSKT